VKKRFPARFWQAWKKEFHVPTGSTEYLAGLIHCSRPDNEIPSHMAEKAHQTLEEWIELELDSDRAATTFYRLHKAERYNNNFEQYPRLRAVGLLSYLALVLAKQKRITKDLFWEVIEKRCRLKGLTPPARIRTATDFCVN